MKTSFFLLAFLLAPSALCADFHVSPKGDDATGDGSAQKPFATIARARDAARTAPGGNTLLLAPGRYFNDAPIVLDDRDSGLTLRGTAPGAAAEVYGGVPVTGWEKWKDGIWRAPVPKGKRFYNMVVDGKPAPMAQWPKRGSGFGGGFRPWGNDALLVPPEFRKADFSDAQVFAFIGGNWFSEMRAAKASAADVRGLVPVDGGSRMFSGMNGRISVRGVLDFLTEPGEWCLKHDEGFVYWWPESGKPEDHLVVRPAGERLFDVEGRKPETPAKGVALKNLSLVGSDFCERWYLFGPGQGSGSTPAPLQQGLVFGENVEGLSVSGCRLLAAGHSAVWLNHRAKDCVVEDNFITGSGFAGVYANGFVPGEGPFKDGAGSHVNKGHRIEGNFIYDCGRNVGGGCGIQFYQAGDSLIARNEIGQMPRYGISFKGERWGTLPKRLYGNALTFASHFDYLHTRNLKVVGNDIYSVCRNSFDFGGIESWGPGRDNLWERNHLHDIDQTLEWNGWAHILFPDDASHWLTMRDNILDHCHGGAATGGFMMKSLDQVIENNLVADCTIGRVISLNAYIEPGGNYVIRRNIFASDGTNTRYAEEPAVFTGFAGTAGGQLPPGTGGIKELDFNTIDPRDPSNPNPLKEKGYETHSFFGAPKLLRAKPDWDMTAVDYSLAPDSPALKLGFKPIAAAEIGLRPDFPFAADKRAATTHSAFRKIQAEDYQRMHDLRTNAGWGTYAMRAGSWAKYAVDFGDGHGAGKAVFALDAAKPNPRAEKPFVRHYGDTEVQSDPFKGDQSVETIEKWEITEPYAKAGKTGSELFDEVFPPEKGDASVKWKPFLASTQSRAGVRTEFGVVDLDVANGEGHANTCAYARASIYAPTGRTNATMTIACASGAKVWLNGELVLSQQGAGTASETKKGILKQGWNTILVKVNQDAAAWTPKERGDGNFWFKFGTVASGCGHIVALPGLPTEERAAVAATKSLVELRLDSPFGELLGKLPAGATECPVKPVSGVHNVFLVYPGAMVRSVDWFRFE